MTRARLIFVAGLVLLLAFVLGASLVRAETAWDAFVARCLAPMSEFQNPDHSGLEPHEIQDFPKRMGDGLVGLTLPESYRISGIDAMLSVGEDLCTVSYVGPHVGLQDFFSWQERVIAEGRYEHTEDHRWWFLSTDWREPKLAIFVSWIPEKSYAVFKAEDTDLES